LKTLRIIAGSAHPALAEAIAVSAGTELTKAKVGQFADGETQVRIQDDVRGADVFVIQPTCPPQNHNLMELLIMLDAVRRASAERVTAVVPYYGYARQDRKHEGRVPITAKLVANLIVTAGADRVLTMDLHATQIQGFFDIMLDHLFAAPVFVKYLREGFGDGLTVLASDPGGIKMAHGYASYLDADLALVEKSRMSDTDVSGGKIVGDIEGKDVLIVDDMITTGGSMAQAITSARENGARRVVAAATHAVLLEKAVERLRRAAPDEVVVTDTIPLRFDPKDAGFKMKILTVAPLLGEAIRRIHFNESVSNLFVHAGGN
jgi:ribose-phosphate pyrophosphokinase